MSLIPEIPAAPFVPLYPALGSLNFNQEAYAYGTAMPGVTTRLREIAAACRECALAAREDAMSAEASRMLSAQQADQAMSYRNQAGNSATAAAGSASTAGMHASTATAALTAMQVMYLGSKAVASHPTTDNMGNPLQSGAMYTNTGANAALNKRGWWWDGATWQLAWGDITGVYMPTTGGKFTGHVEVPAGATGNQAPRASEVVSRKITYAGVGTNMNTLPLVNGAWSGRDWVNAPSAESPWWYVEQIVHEENYVTQTSLGLTDATPKYFRIQVGGVWQQWRRILDAIDLREKVFASSTGAGPGDAKLYFLDPSKGSIHQLTVQYNTYFTGALRGIGDQLTLRLKFSGGAWPISFNTNFRFPAGTVFPNYVAGQTLTLTFVNTEGSFIDAFIVGVHNP